MSDDIPVGYYSARVVAGSEQVFENAKGNVSLSLELDVPDLNRKVKTYLHFTSKSAQFSYEKLKICGWRGESAEDLSDLSELDRNEVRIHVTRSFFEGETKTNVQIVSPAKSSNTRVLTSREFVARVRDLVNAGSPRPSLNPPEPELDEIPF